MCTNGSEQRLQREERSRHHLRLDWRRTAMRTVHAEKEKRQEGDEEVTRQNMVVHAARNQPDLEIGNRKADAPTFECHASCCADPLERERERERERVCVCVRERERETSVCVRECQLCVCVFACVLGVDRK